MSGLDRVAASVEGIEIEGTVSHAKIVRVQAFIYEALPGRVVFGLGSRLHVPDEVAELDATRVFLIASGSATAAADEIADALGDGCAARWVEVAEHVPVELAERARNAARAVQADAIVCVGGGSAIGLAKAVALELDRPIVAVPTTYAGSEMTPMYGLTGHHKHTGRDPRVLPRAVVYDPELTRTLPVATSAGSALNALAHCVEGLYGPGANPVTSLAAIEGIRVLADAIPQLASDPENLETRSALLYGAYLAGTVIATVGVGIHHRTCHVLGGSYGLGHASCNAVVLPHAIAFNAPDIPEITRRLADVMVANDPAAFVYDLAAGVGLPVSLERLGLPEAALDDAAARVVEETHANPRAVDVASVRTMLDAAWRGTRPSAPVDSR